MAIPTIVGVSASAAVGAGNITPAFPSGYSAVADDILITFREVDNPATADVPAGWALLAEQGVSSGVTTKLNAIWRRAQNGDTAPALSHSGTTNHQIGRMIVIRGCITTGNPWDQAVVSQETLSDTSVSMPTVTTTVADCLILNAFSTGQDANSSANASAWTNANLATPSIGEQMDNWTNTGNGGGFGVSAGGKAAAGSTGASTATVGTANFKALMTIALKPALTVALPTVPIMGPRVAV